MNGVMTATRSRTDSFTEARLAAVMPEVGADFYSMAGAGLLPLDMAMKWTEELSFILKHRAARGFQVQLTCPGRDKIALDYRVSSDGSVHNREPVQVDLEPRQIATIALCTPGAASARPDGRSSEFCAHEAACRACC
jgi:hypothetical protein